MVATVRKTRDGVTIVRDLKGAVYYDTNMKVIRMVKAPRAPRIPRRGKILPLRGAKDG